MSIQLPFNRGDKILELGSGDKPLKAEGIDVVTVDVRQLPGVSIVRNLEEDFSDIGFYDGIFGNYIAEHISWRRIDTFFRSCFNVLKEDKWAVFVTSDTEEQMKLVLSKSEWDIGVSQMLYGDQNYSDNNHKIAFSKSLITKLLKGVGFNEVHIQPHPDTNARDMIVFAHKPRSAIEILDLREDKGLTKINFGSFTVMFKDWINTDVIDLTEYAKANGFTFKQIDVRQPLPFEPNSVDLITAHHLLEHLTRDEGKRFLLQCKSIMRKGGVIRLSIPNNKLIAEKYVNNKITEFSSINEGVKNAKDDAEAFWNLITAGHVTGYDEESLLNLVRGIGFEEVRNMPYGKSRSNAIETQTKDSFPELSSYIEGIKGDDTYDDKVTTNTENVATKDEPIHKYLRGEIKEGVQ